MSKIERLLCNYAKETMDLKWSIRVQGFTVVCKVEEGTRFSAVYDDAVIVRLIIKDNKYFVAILRKPDGSPPRFTMTCLRRILMRLSTYFGEKPVELFAFGRVKHDNSTDYELKQLNLVKYYESYGFKLQHGSENMMSCRFNDIKKGQKLNDNTKESKDAVIQSHYPPNAFRIGV